MAATMHDLLTIMIERAASDLHITTGTYPQIRVHGKLTPLTPVRAAHAPGHAAPRLQRAQRGARSRSSRRTTSSTSPSASRDWPASAATSSASAERWPARSASSPSRSRDLRRAGPPADRRADGGPAQGPHPGDGADGLGQVDDARRDGGQDQLGAQRAHHHDRGSHRVRAPAQEVPGESARGVLGHPVVQERAQVHPAPGPRRRARRRDARPRDHLGRAHHRGDRPPHARARCTPTRAPRP